jgi:hypothetical protein
MALADETFMTFPEFCAHAQISKNQLLELLEEDHIQVKSSTKGMSYIIGSQRSIDHAREILGLGPIREVKKNPYLELQE